MASEVNSCGPNIAIPDLTGPLTEQQVQKQFSGQVNEFSFPNTINGPRAEAQGYSAVKVASTSHIPVLGFFYNHTIGPFAGESAWAIRKGTIGLDVPASAVTDKRPYNLPGSTTKDPKIGLQVTIDIDKAHTFIQDPKTVNSNASEGIVAREANVITDNGDEGRNASSIIGLTDANTRDDCVRSDFYRVLAPVLSKNIGRILWFAYQSDRDAIHGLLNTPDLVRQRELAINPVRVILIHDNETPTDPQSYKAIYSNQTQQAIVGNLAHELGAKKSDISTDTKQEDCNLTNKAATQAAQLAGSYQKATGQTPIKSPET
ncbi:MAG TPA: hypothetical protein VLG27_03170 [Candidatus Saccharimonadia bacterium]|nr:hypothetical protein [Candidatus Saccharimonadia bacterium]